MSRRTTRPTMRLHPLLLGAALLLAACQPRERVATLPAPAAPSMRAAPGLDPVAGEWSADRALALHAQPSTGSAVVARIAAGQPLQVMGRARGTDWVAVSTGSGMAYVRLHLLRLRGEPRPQGNAPVIMPKPTDNDGPAVKAAPRSRIEAAPLPAS